MSSSTILPLLSAAASAGDAPPAWLQFLPLVAMGVIFWFLILRPQMRQQKEHRTRIASVKKGGQAYPASSAAFPSPRSPQ